MLVASLDTWVLSIVFAILGVEVIVNIWRRSPISFEHVVFMMSSLNHIPIKSKSPIKKTSQERKKRQNSRQTIWREFEPVDPTMLENRLGAGWGLLPWGANKLLFHRTNTRRMDWNTIVPIVGIGKHVLDLYLEGGGWSIGSIQKQWIGTIGR